MTATYESVTLTLRIPEGWIDCSILNVDLFRHNCCGYWAYGVSQRESDGAWLLFEHDDNPETMRTLNGDVGDDIDSAWCDLETKPARVIESHGFDPDKFFVIDREVAKRIYAECVRLYGESEAESADASQIDCATQMALLGEIRYG